jgi:hypothetical protein
MVSPVARRDRGLGVYLLCRSSPWAEAFPYAPRSPASVLARVGPRPLVAVFARVGTLPLASVFGLVLLWAVARLSA